MKFEREEYLKDLSEFRYATKRFDSTKKIQDTDWKILEEALRLSPSSYGLQPWKFVVITNQALKDQLKPVSWNQTQISDCSHLVVFTTLERMTESHVDAFIEDTAKTRGVDVASLKAYRDMMVSDVVTGPRSKVAQAWMQRQAYLAFGNLMTTAAILHIDACPLEGIDPVAYDKILGLDSSEFRTVSACALGFRHPEDKYASAKKVRFPRDRVFDFRT